jgi:hypothetical protein
VSEAFRHRLPTGHQTIFRVAYRSLPFSQIGNDMMRDERLSIEARGSLALVLTYPPDWAFNMKWLAKIARMGRDQTRRVVHELIRHKYCLRRELRLPNKTISYEYAFTDQPGQFSEPDTENQSPGDRNPATARRTTAGRHRTNKEDKQIKTKARKRAKLTAAERLARAEAFAAEMIDITEPVDSEPARKFWLQQWVALNGGGPLPQSDGNEFMEQVGQAEEALWKLQSAYAAALDAGDAERAKMLIEQVDWLDAAIEAYATAQRKYNRIVNPIFNARLQANPRYAKD